MATLKINGNEYYYEEHGPKTAPALVLSPPVFTNSSVYEPLIRMLSDDYRVFVYDHRGSGQSARPASPDLAHSVKDVAAFIEKLNIGPCHFVGNCLGSFVGLQLAISRSDLLKSCTLIGAVAEAESPEYIRNMDGFIANAKKNGMKASINAFAEMWFGPTFRASKDPVQVSRRQKWLNYVSNLNAQDLDQFSQILHRKDLSHDLGKVHCSLLILEGDEDSSTNREGYRRLTKGVTGAEFKTIHHAGYALIIEQPEEVAENIRTFINKVDRAWAQRQKQAPRGKEVRPSH